MLKRTTVLLPGDGIGGAVLKEAVKVLETVGYESNYVEAPIGWEYWKTIGNPLPQETLDLLEKHNIGLFGAITSKPKEAAQEELMPHLKNKGLVYYSPIVGLRQHFNLDVCIRPCETFLGNPLNFIRRKIDGGFEEPLINIAVFRQNTEGLYAGVEWTNPPELIRNAFKTHQKFKRFENTVGDQLAISTRIFTQKACDRICRSAFEYAKKLGYERVTICEKPNVIRETSGMMERTAYKIAKEYPDIWTESTNIDAQCMWLTKNPEDYGVIIAGNMFGDIISDASAGLVGGLGFASSGNIGDEVAVFEPTHGSAPKYAEYKTSIVNPIAMILSAAMMLNHIGEFDKANKVKQAIRNVVADGKVRTYDMLKIRGKEDVIFKGAASTEQMGDAICQEIEKLK